MLTSLLKAFGPEPKLRSANGMLTSAARSRSLLSSRRPYAGWAPKILKKSASTKKAPVNSARSRSWTPISPPK